MPDPDGLTREPVTRQRHGLAESLEAASLRIPFRVKVALVWAVIFALLIFAFLKSGFDIPWMIDKAPAIVKGVWVTILFSIIAITLAMILALLGALGRISKNPIAYGVSGFYTSFFRGTPLIVQLFLWYLALPQLALGLLPPEYAAWFVWPAAVAGVVGIAFNYGAYMTEIFRAGLQSIHHGQWEAAEALGLERWQILRRVILPQAIRIIIPDIGNQFIAMQKDSALVSVMGVWEITYLANKSARIDSKYIELFLVAAALYWLLTIVSSYFQNLLEKRMAHAYER